MAFMLTSLDPSSGLAKRPAVAMRCNVGRSRWERNGHAGDSGDGVGPAHMAGAGVLAARAHPPLRKISPKLKCI
jgi:hypothetical protein